jgi:hypothetical protein
VDESLYEESDESRGEKENSQDNLNPSPEHEYAGYGLFPKEPLHQGVVVEVTEGFR